MFFLKESKFQPLICLIKEIRESAYSCPVGLAKLIFILPPLLGCSRLLLLEMPEETLFENYSKQRLCFADFKMSIFLMKFR